jgi:hypothetical protein
MKMCDQCDMNESLPQSTLCQDCLDYLCGFEVAEQAYESSDVDFPYDYFE